MKNLILVILVLLSSSYAFGQQIRAVVSGNSYNDNDNVYIGCSSGSINVQIQYNYNGNWYAASHLNVDNAPSGWGWTFQPTNNFNKTSIDFNKNYPTSSGQIAITWNAPGVFGSSSQFRLNIYATPQIYFTSTPAIYGNSSNTYSVYANTSGNVNWTAYGGLSVNGSGSYCCGQSATISTQNYGGSIEVTASNGCGTSPAISFPVFTPFVQNGTINGSNASNATVSYVASLYLNTRGTATGANWTITNGSGSISPSGTSCNAYPNNFIRVVGAATNQYGTGQDWTFYIFKDGYSPYRMAYPNPAHDQVNLEFDDSQMAEELLNSISILDETGKSWRNFDSKVAKKENYFKNTKIVKIDVKDLAKKEYYIQINFGNKIYREHLVIE